jgi:hypothetical protein
MADNERTVTMTIKSVSSQQNNQGEQDFKLEVEAPFFKSQFPTIIYVPEDVGARVKGGDEVTYVLRGMLKDGKSGKKPYDYNWRFVSLADRNVAAAERTHEAVAGVTLDDPRGYSIERQVAAKAAVDILTSIPVIYGKDGEVISGPPTTEAFTTWAEHIIGWIQRTNAAEGGHLVRAAMELGARPAPDEPASDEPPEGLPEQPTSADDLQF